MHRLHQFSPAVVEERAVARPIFGESMNMRRSERIEAGAK